MAGQFQLFEFSDVSCANAALRVLWQFEPAIHRRTGNQNVMGAWHHFQHELPDQK